MKKLLALLMATVMILVLAACAPKDGDKDLLGMSDAPIADVELNIDYEVPEDFKIGFICLHDEQSTYDKNFLNC